MFSAVKLRTKQLHARAEALTFTYDPLYKARTPWARGCVPLHFLTSDDIFPMYLCAKPRVRCPRAPKSAQMVSGGALCQPSGVDLITMRPVLQPLVPLKTLPYRV